MSTCLSGTGFDRPVGGSESGVLRSFVSCKCLCVVCLLSLAKLSGVLSCELMPDLAAYAQQAESMSRSAITDMCTHVTCVKVVAFTCGSVVSA